MESVTHAGTANRGTPPAESSSLPTSGSASRKHATEHLYLPVAESLGAVEIRLRSELRSRFDELNPLLEHGVLLGGKRLRPALVLLSGSASGPLTDDHVTIATVVEMVHTATLVHDDVLDHAEHRRHLPTVNARWDNSASILLGDFLFSHSFYLAATLGSTEACQMIGRASRRVCEGELRQVMRAGDVSIDEGTYLQLVEGKTAELTQVCCELGARLSGAEPAIVRSLAEYGRCLGIAFQIADDFLDLWGQDRRVGKTLGSDVGQGKATLPLIHALRHGDRSLRDSVMRAMTSPGDRRAVLLPLLERAGSREYTLQRARHFAESAIDAIGGLNRGAAQESLRQLARFAIDRKY